MLYILLQRLVFRIKLIFHFYCISFETFKIPKKSFRLGGHLFQDDSEFLNSSIVDLELISKYVKVNEITNFLDYGCGNGRLLFGILKRNYKLNYTGIDTDWKRIDWLKHHYDDENLSFFHFNIYNERYNKKGINLIKIDFKTKVKKKKYLIWLHSIFSHLDEMDSKILISKFDEITVSGSYLILTGFFENDVENITINPQNYKNIIISGPLHVVRYNLQYFIDIVTNSSDLQFVDFEQDGGRDGQSVLVFKKI